MHVYHHQHHNIPFYGICHFFDGTLRMLVTCLGKEHLNPVQIGPEGLGDPFCSYRTASPRCPSYKLAEPNVHRGRFLLQNGTSYKMSHRFCSTRIRSHPLARFALYRMVGTGGGYTRTILGSLGSNLQQPGQPESRFIFSVLLRSSVCFGVTLSEWPS